MPKHFEKHIWTEAIAFDPQARDYGVSRYLAGCGFRPERISLLSCCPDFIHLHDGRIDNTILLREYCSYGGRASKHRWTRRKLKGLIDRLHQEGIEVFLSFMANMIHPNHERESAWAKGHPEVIMTDKYGNRSLYPEGRFQMCLLNPIARFRDGRYYQDFFAGQLARTLVDYGFDGFHGADGYKCLIKTLEHADYSPGIIGQFEDWLGEKLPKPARGLAAKKITWRAEMIWKHHRLEWIEFYCKRWAEFWKNVADQTTPAGKKVAINSAWHYAPVDAIGRFGIDYRRLYEAGIREIYCEHGCSGAWAILGSYAGPDSDRPGGWVIPWEEMFVDCQAGLLQIKAYVPEFRLYPFTATFDPFECTAPFYQLPGSVERDIYALGQQYIAGKERPENGSAGMLEAIADHLEPHEWKWINDRWEIVKRFRARRLPGPCLVWSDGTLPAEIEHSETRWSTHRLLMGLQQAGCAVISARRIDNLKTDRSSALLVLNPWAWPKEQIDRIFAQVGKGCLAAVIGDARHWRAPQKNLRLVLRDVASRLTLWLYGPGKIGWDEKKILSEFKESAAIPGVNLTVKNSKKRPITITCKSRNISKPYELTPQQSFHFMTRVPADRVPSNFMKLAGTILSRRGWPQLARVNLKVGPTRREPLSERGSAIFIETAARRGIVIVQNYTMRAIWVEITMDRPISKAAAVGGYAMPPHIDGRRFDLRIPIQGTAIATVVW